MSLFRREFLYLASSGPTGAAATAAPLHTIAGVRPNGPDASVWHKTLFSVKQYGAQGDGIGIDTPAISRATEAVSESGGVQVLFLAGPTCRIQFI